MKNVCFVEVGVSKKKYCRPFWWIFVVFADPYGNPSLDFRHPKAGSLQETNHEGCSVAIVVVDSINMNSSFFHTSQICKR